VVAINYRLSPEYKFPIPLEDCFSVLHWLINDSKIEKADMAKVYLMGDSAGGNFAANLLSLNRDRNTGFDFHKTVLIYPALATKKQYESKVKFDNGYIITGKLAKWFEMQYLNSEDDYENKYVSPLKHENLSGLPQTLIIQATEDYIYSEGQEYAQRLIESGVKVEIKEYKSAHGFFTLSKRLWEEGIKDILEFLPRGI